MANFYSYRCPSVDRRCDDCVASIVIYSLIFYTELNMNDFTENDSSISIDQSSQIWIVYCAVDQQYSIHIPYQQGMTALQALDASGLAKQVTLPEPLALGIFGLRIKDPATHILQAGDRLEVYRLLTMNPKDVRRRRAEKHPVGRYQQGNQQKKRQDQQSSS